MSVSAISSSSQAAALQELHQPVAAQPAAKSSQSSIPTDTVTLSHAAQKAPAGDVDHDGDSH